MISISKPVEKVREDTDGVRSESDRLQLFICDLSRLPIFVVGAEELLPCLLVAGQSNTVGRCKDSPVQSSGS